MSLKLGTYQWADAPAVMNALFNPAALVHQHLDWQDLREWLYERGLLMALAWQGREVTGALAFSPPYDGATWLRLLILPDEGRGAVLAALWDFLRPSLMAVGVRLVAAMSNDSWLGDCLAPYGFRHVDSVVHLQRPALALPEYTPKVPGLAIRSPWRWQWGQVLRTDQAAFGPPWQFRPYDFRITARRATLLRVGMMGGRVVAYQLSRAYRHNIHLIRLATLPDYQNRGIARAMLDDFLRQSHRRGYPETSVNTQASNLPSRHLYESYNFHYESDSTGVYFADLH